MKWRHRESEHAERNQKEQTMLAYKFQLTPAQVDMLLCFYFGDYRTIDKSDSLMLDFNNSHFVPIGAKLMEKGLVTHDNTRNPTWLITSQGKSIAELIVAEAKKIAARVVKPVKVKTHKVRK